MPITIQLDFKAGSGKVYAMFIFLLNLLFPIEVPKILLLIINGL